MPNNRFWRQNTQHPVYIDCKWEALLYEADRDIAVLEQEKGKVSSDVLLAIEWKLRSANAHLLKLLDRYGKHTVDDAMQRLRFLIQRVINARASAEMNHLDIDRLRNNL